jgi:hypothetical protein
MKFSNPFSRNTRTEKHVPRFPGALPNSPGIGAPVNPVLASGVDASGQAGPVFAQGAQGAFGLQAVDVVLSSAQLLALLGTPITVVPAPAAGFRIVLLGVKIILFGGSVAYTDAGGAVQFAVGTAVYPLASNAVFLVTVTPNRAVLHTTPVGAASTGANPPTDDGAALTIGKVTNNLAAGNGTAKVTVYFVIEPTT